MPDRSEGSSQLPQNLTRLLGPKDVFSDTQFGEVLSPVVEPATDKDWSIVQGYLADLGFSGLRPSSTQKLGVLLSSFLMQSMRLEGRRERRGEAMLIGRPHMTKTIGEGALTVDLKARQSNYGEVEHLHGTHKVATKYWYLTLLVFKGIGDGEQELRCQTQ